MGGEQLHLASPIPGAVLLLLLHLLHHLLLQSPSPSLGHCQAGWGWSWELEMMTSTRV